MKRTLLIVSFAAIAASSCAGDKKYTVSGVWEGGDGMKIYIKAAGASKSDPYIDSVTVAAGRFLLTSPDLGKVVELHAQGASVGQAVIFEHQPVEITVGKEYGKPSISVDQSAEQALLAAYKLKKTQINFMQLGGMFAMVEVKDDPVKLDSVRKGVAAVQAELDRQFRAKLDSNAHMLASAYAIETLILPNRPPEESLEAYGKLSDEVKKSYAGQHLKIRIDEQKDVNVGGIAPDIDLATPEGTHVKLSSLRGKYVLLDFWASWCGPCLREVPNVKAIREQYRDRGFEVYGVSLDKESQKADWIAAIEKNGMDWVQVSSLKGWECPVAKRYAVTGIPRMFLIDPQGRIIAQDLRGEALREKVASLLE